MGKQLFIAEKPSVANEFSKALHENFSKNDGYLESDNSVVTWCYGHLVTMSYPDAYDPALKRWSFETIPFLPKEYLYELNPSTAKQFKIVKGLLNRKDVETIYVCTDSGREGEYIYRLVDDMAKVPDTKDKRRVWIDSQTEEEILRGIKEAKPLSEYNNLSDAAYLRAKEDYLMGINFSRALTLKYGYLVSNSLRMEKSTAIAVGRVMTCVLGIVVRREREIRNFVKTPFYRVFAGFDEGFTFEGEFKAVKGSRYFESPLLYKENGFKSIDDARELIKTIGGEVHEVEMKKDPDSKEKYSEKHDKGTAKAVITSIEKKAEKKNPPLLFNLAELQNDCSQTFKISPDETLQITQDLYEKKLVTYPRTDARVLSTAVSKEIYKNLNGLKAISIYEPFASNILNNNMHQGLAKTRYVNDSQITDHYAIIPTGNVSNLNSLDALHKKVYDRIVRRFLSIFYLPAVYDKISLNVDIDGESFKAGFKALKSKGYLEVFPQKAKEKSDSDKADKGDGDEITDESFLEKISSLKKGSELNISEFTIKEGETSPPSRYNSGSLILTMEKAGQFIEDEELRAQIKGSGIGTSATRAEILNKLVKNAYLKLNKKTQIITPTLMGEMIYEVVNASVKSLLNAELTASWEKGLTGVSDGNITKDEYMTKLEGYVSRITNTIKDNNYSGFLRNAFADCAKYY